MAQKKVPSPEEALITFKSAMQRASLSDYIHVNKVLLSKNPKDKSVLIIPGDALWLKIIEDSELKDHIKELNISDPEETRTTKIFSYANEIDLPSWIEVDSEKLMKGEVIKVNIHGFDYDVPINRDLLPIKLRKAECNNVSYRVSITSESAVFILKKKFEYPVDGCDFTLMRIYQVI